MATALVLAGCSAGTQSSGGNVGFSVGGAKDVDTFRTNVEEGYLPTASTMTHEGLFYDYSFDAKEPRECSQLFCPTYSRAVTRDPLSNETEYYMAVGLNSNIEQDEFERKKLNLVVVLDVSGSMSSPFNRYYYDDQGNKHETNQRNKLAAAKEALGGMLDQLKPGDRVGVVVFDENARTVVEMRRVGERDMEVVRSKVENIRTGGSTNLASGMDRARSMLSPYTDVDASNYENRVIYLTDAMPNTGDTGSEGLQGRLSADAERDIHTTFVGVGVDFNTDLVRTISDIRGANYYAVHSGEQFTRRMDEEFEYMVTPLVFDLSLSVESEGWNIEQVYGAPEADSATDELMHVDTLFPSPTTNGSTKGGVILVELERTGESEQLRLAASYEDRNGTARETTRTVQFAEQAPEYFESTAVRKAVALTRYGTLLRNWVTYERARLAEQSPATPPKGIDARGDAKLGEWEQRSTELRVSLAYRERFARFARYFEREMVGVDDENLERELALLRTLADYEEGNASTDAASGQGATDTGTLTTG